MTVIIDDQTVAVDADDLDLATRIKWRIAPNGYVFATVYLHRLVSKAPRDQHVDHIDRNKLNNQKSNLRLVSRSENMRNRNPYKMRKHSARSYNRKQSFSHRHKNSALSRFRGVSWNDGRWVAYVTVNKIRQHLGRFKSETAAARAYNQAAKQAFGRRVALNRI